MYVSRKLDGLDGLDQLSDALEKLGYVWSAASFVLDRKSYLFNSSI